MLLTQSGPYVGQLLEVAAQLSSGKWDFCHTAGKLYLDRVMGSSGNDKWAYGGCGGGIT